MYVELEDLLKHKKTLKLLEWDTYSLECLNGIEGQLLMNVIELKEEIMALRKELNQLKRKTSNDHEQ